jgi:hypothetical protein
MTSPSPQVPWQRFTSAPAPAAPPKPIDVGTARHLLWVTAALQLITGLVSAFDPSTRAMMLAMVAEDPVVAGTLSQEQVNASITMGTWLGALMLVGITALVLLVVQMMWSGKAWGRTIMTILSAMAVFSAIPVLLDIPSAGLGGPWGIVMSVGTLLEAVCAAGAIWMMYRRESNEYFLPKPQPGSRDFRPF